MTKYFCSTCRVWVPDDPISRKRHESASSHIRKTQEAVERSLKATREQQLHDAEISAVFAEIRSKAQGIAPSSSAVHRHPLSVSVSDTSSSVSSPAPPVEPRKRPLPDDVQSKPTSVDSNTGLGTWTEVAKKPEIVASKQTGSFGGMKIPRNASKRRKLEEED
jgi:hypothetical protein